eukprot:354912-Pelagomonas_calceolata.AAC.1
MVTSPVLPSLTTLRSGGPRREEPVHHLPSPSRPVDEGEKGSVGFFFTHGVCRKSSNTASHCHGGQQADFLVRRPWLRI